MKSLTPFKIHLHDFTAHTHKELCLPFLSLLNFLMIWRHLLKNFENKNDENEDDERDAQGNFYRPTWKKFL
jgi:hypothetical protein